MKCRAIETLTFYWWDCKMIQALQKKSVAVFYQITYILTIRSSNSSCSYLSGMKVYVCSQTYIGMFVAALSWIVKTWKQPKCPSCVDGSTNCSIFILEYSSAIKWNILLIHTKHRWISKWCWEKEARHGKLHTVRFPLYEVLEQAKVTYSDRN